MDLEKLKYPIGGFNPLKSYSVEIKNQWIQEIEDFPKKLDQLTNKLSKSELNWKYRPEGWTIKQVIHHCADSHMNSLMRFKLTLTEKLPNIRPYYEDRWAELPDALDDDISTSVLLLSALHKKWTKLLNTLSKDQLKLEFVHPEHGKKFSLEENIGIYAWHGNHHLAHIKQAINYKGEFNS